MKSLYEEGHIKYELKNPLIKDTIIVPNRGYTIIRFLADNPGVWLLHCHIEFHSALGL